MLTQNILTWNNISYQILNKDKTILNNVSGNIKSGNLSCIIGPSGSGKTSLLNILSGRTINRKNNQISGTITYNNIKITPSLFSKKISYVTQNDYLLPFVTVYEALWFSIILKTITVELSSLTTYK